MLGPRTLIVALGCLASACTIVVPVGVDPVIPEWTAPMVGTGVRDTGRRGCDVPVLGPELCDGLDNDCDGVTDEAGVCDRVTTFDQVADLDILFVLDPRSAAEHVVFKLSEAMPSLLAPLAVTRREVHIGAISMDAESIRHRGRLLAPRGDTYTVVGFDGVYAPANEFLGRAVQLLEPPLGRVGARFVTQEALATDRPVNEAFVRDGGYLGLIYVSTTDDVEPPSINQLATRLDEMWQPGRWSVSAIVQVRPTDCQGDPSPEHVGETYRMMWGETEGGVLADHCLPSYDAVLAEIAQSLSIQSLTDTFVLLDPVDPSSVGVEVNLGDGFSVLPRHRFQVDERSIILDRPPPPSAEVRVSYTIEPGTLY